jgi:hypothetical protein
LRFLRSRDPFAALQVVAPVFVVLSGNSNPEFTMKTQIVRCAGWAFSSILAPAAIAATFTVTNTSDSGAGSLRDSINQANGNGVADLIQFNIPGPGVVTIALASPLPPLTDQAGVTIDGFTQPGASAGPNPPATLNVLVELDGSGITPAGHGIHIRSSNNVVRGMCVRSFPYDGISIEAVKQNLGGANDNVIEHNVVGTDPGGVLALPNGTAAGGLWAGIYVKVLPQSEPFAVAYRNIIRRNLSSGNHGEGIGIASCPDVGDCAFNQVLGNHVGTDLHGVGPLGNARTGIYLGEGTHDNFVGESGGVADPNTISANGYEGVSIVGYAEAEPNPWFTDNNLVRWNRIGVNVNLVPLGNSLSGVAIGAYGAMDYQKTGFYFGGHARHNVVADNVIAHNLRCGVIVWEWGQLDNLRPDNASFNTIRQNSIYENGNIDPGYLGIDLQFDGVTFNDYGPPPDGDSGPNRFLNFPNDFMTVAYNGGGTATVSGTIAIDSNPAQARVEVFRAVPDTTGPPWDPAPTHGEGAVYLGTAVPTAGGTWTLNVSGVAPGDWLTATTTDLTGNTSEFARNVKLEGDDEVDFGDAPDPTYPTLLVRNGARHVINPQMFLGALIDGEPDGQPHPNALGDDMSSQPDEDGVSFGPLVPGTAAQFTVYPSLQGRIDAWIDFNADGDWYDAGEQVASSVAVGPPSAVINFNVPPTVPAGMATFARVRYSTAGGLAVTGTAVDGEVEDYELTIDDPNAGTLGDWVWDDLNQNGIQDAGEPGLDGVQVDLLDGSGNLLVSTTTVGGGYYQFGGLAPGTYQLQFYLLTGYVFSPQDQGSDDTIDSDANPSTGLTALINVVAGVTDLTWDAGMYQQQEPEEFDWGDAPDSAAAPVYPTLLANNGARHQIVIGGPVLGNAIDAEPDGQPSSAADGDDINGAVPDDEDGVTFPTALIVPVPAAIQVTSATGGILQGWIDWNGDGDWLDTGEQVITNLPLPAGTTAVPITVPWGATGGANGLTYARFRISSLQGLGFAGPAPDGEVEDYLVRLEPLKWLQIPEQGHEGVDVNNTDHMLADDFQCTASGPITDFHIWGSFLGDNLPEEGPGGLTFDVSIWSDVPKGVDAPHSHPGQQLWQMTFTPGQYSAGHILQVIPGEWWHDPGTQNWVPNADQNIYQFDFYPPKGEAFVQEEGTIYWLAVKYRYQGSSQWTGKFGWKTTPQPWNDDACYQDPASPVGWTDMIYPPQHPWGPDSLNLAFALSGEEPEEENADYGDAPDDPLNPNDYPTWSASNGASHLLGSQFYLGFANAPPDAEPDGQPTTAADGDDLNGAVPDDEDGVTFQSWLIPGISAVIKVDVVTPAGAQGYLNGWIDFNRDGDWADPGEHFVVDQASGSGPAFIGFVVPPGALPGPTYARFRFTSQTLASLGLNEGGQAPDGEVEDYLVAILDAPDGVDFGDAPDAPYPTFIVNGGARHLIVPGYHMGVAIDAEPDGQPTPIADGDDLGGMVPDDEDGVVFYPLFIGQLSAIDVSVTGSGLIDAWIDFNANGSWLDAGEQIAASVAVTAGRNQITFTVPTVAVAGPSFARVRFSSAGGLAPTGGAQDGEVEDYWVDIPPHSDLVYDFGDAPDPGYPTLAASNGARHLLSGGLLRLGAVVDPEPDGQPTPNASGDDNVGIDDEDGVSFAYALIGGQSSLVQVTASAPGFIDVWIDWNANGSWADLGDNVLSAYAVTPGVNYVPIAVPSLTYTGPTMMRVRISSTGYLPPTGFASDGEVEDHELFLYEEGGMDFGDAPNSSISPATSYETTMRDFGAAHFIDSLFLGWLIDAESDGQPAALADGDDLNPPASLADEDGVTFTSPWISGVAAQVNVTVNSAAPGPAYDLDLWVDWDGDGTWAQANERVLAATPVVPGMNSLTIPVPSGLSPMWAYARFRLTHPGTGVGYTGYVMGGEVEDYRIPTGVRVQAGISVNNSTIPPQVVLTWPAVTGAANYSIYSSTNLGAGFPNTPNWTLETTTASLTWSDPITLSKKFYIVVAFP